MVPLGIVFSYPSRVCPIQQSPLALSIVHSTCESVFLHNGVFGCGIVSSAMTPLTIPCSLAITNSYS